MSAEGRAAADAAAAEAQDSAPGGGADGAGGLPKGAGDSASASRETDDGWRVKVYLLSEDAEWLDIGTGFATVGIVRKLGGYAIKVTCEETRRLLLQTKVAPSNIYKHSQENIITWEEPDPESAAELALSFQENEGCNTVWRRIQEAVHSPSKRSEGVPGMASPAGALGGEGVAGGIFRHDREVDVDFATAPGGVVPRAPGLSGVGLPGDGAAAGAVSLPEVSEGTLDELLEQLSKASFRDATRDAASRIIMREQYLPKLLALFEEAEAGGRGETLAKLVPVVRALAGLSDPILMDVLLSDECFLKVAGIFEYDPALKAGSERGFRRFLSSEARLLQVVPLSDDGLVAKIRQNFRIVFLKDVLLRPMMDDKCLVVLNSLTFYNNTEIVQSLLQQDRSFLRRLFQVLDGAEEAPAEAGSPGPTPSPNPRSSPRAPRSSPGQNAPNPSPKAKAGAGAALKSAGGPCTRRDRRAALTLVHELFDIIKTLQLAMRQSIMRTIFEDVAFFPSLARVLMARGRGGAFGGAGDRHKALDVLSITLLHDPSLFRQHTLRECEGDAPEGPPKRSGAGARLAGASAVAVEGEGAPRPWCCLLFWVVRSLTAEDSLGVVLEAADALKILLDVNSMDDQERDSFLTLWYNKRFVEWFAEPLLRFAGPALASLPEEQRTRRVSAAKELLSEMGSVGREALGAILEVSCQLMAQHKYRFKYHAVKMGLFPCVALLLRAGDAVLRLGALRFLRSCVGLVDDFLNQHLVKTGVVDAVVHVLRRHGRRDDLVRSSLAELFAAVARAAPDGRSAIVACVAERYRADLEAVEGTNVFRDMLGLHESAKADLRALECDEQGREDAEGTPADGASGTESGDDEGDGDAAQQKRQKAEGEAPEDGDGAGKRLKVDERGGEGAESP